MTAFTPVRWARRAPAVRRSDGRPDHVARLVLIVLATYADRDGSGARPGLETLAEDCDLTTRAVASCLARLQEAKLISEETVLTGGTVVWRLHLNVVRDGPSVLEQRAEQRRRATAERVRRHRAKIAGNAAPQRDVTPSDGVTTVDDVTPSDGVSNAVVVRYQRRGTALLTPSPALQPQVAPATSPSELPLELPEEHPLPAAPGARDRVEPDEFESFWRTYPRRVGKTAARRAWAKATKTASASAILAGAERYARERDGQDDRYTAHPATWLHAGRWDDEPARPALRAVGHQTYRNPEDPSVYYEELI